MEEALIELLLAHGGVAAEAGDRVWPVSRPQGSALPAVTLTRISGGPIYTDAGEEARLAQARVEIDAWAESYGAAKILARAVTAALSAYVGTAGTSPAIAFQYILLDAERDFREEGANKAEYLHRVNQDYIVWWRTI